MVVREFLQRQDPTEVAKRLALRNNEANEYDPAVMVKVLDEMKTCKCVKHSDVAYVTVKRFKNAFAVSMHEKSTGNNCSIDSFWGTWIGVPIHLPDNLTKTEEAEITAELIWDATWWSYDNNTEY